MRVCARAREWNVHAPVTVCLPGFAHVCLSMSVYVCLCVYVCLLVRVSMCLHEVIQVAMRVEAICVESSLKWSRLEGA